MKMKIHEREFIVNEAECEIEKAFIDVMIEIKSKHELTIGEEIKIVTSVLTHWLGSIAKYMIRDERHGDSDKLGGLA